VPFSYKLIRADSYDSAKDLPETVITGIFFIDNSLDDFESFKDKRMNVFR
jgi:hypothetical protein